MVSGFCVISAKQFGLASFLKTWKFENFAPSKLCFPESKACIKFPSVRRWPCILSFMKRLPQHKGWTATSSFCRALYPGSYPIVELWIEKEPPVSRFLRDTLDESTPHFIPIKYALTDMFYPIFPENPFIKVVLMKQSDWVKFQKSSPNPI